MVEAIAAILALATGPNHIYLYGTPSWSLECASRLTYVETLGNSVLVADECALVGVDFTYRPLFPIAPIRTNIGFDYTPKRLRGVCNFIAHADNGNGTTSTVIDCR